MRHIALPLLSASCCLSMLRHASECFSVPFTAFRCLSLRVSTVPILIICTNTSFPAQNVVLKSAEKILIFSSTPFAKMKSGKSQSKINDVLVVPK